MINILDNPKNYRLGGRNITKDGVLYLSYSASYIEFKVRARKVTARLKSDGHDDTMANRGWVFTFINNCDRFDSHFAVTKEEAEYVIYEGNGMEEATIRIMKGSEVAFENVGIVSIDVDGSVYELEPSYKKLIEYVGDSITCGYGFYGIAEKDLFTTEHENPWDNYAGKTARKLGVDYQSIAWSGNGVVSHYMDTPAEPPRTENFFMQDLYPYSDAEFERRQGISEYTPWDFKRQADLVVINLGTNDSSYTDNVESRNKKYDEAYKGLVSLVRKNNPNANILCILGVMDQCLTTTLEQTVKDINTSGDNKVFFLEIPLQLESDGYATDYHPSPITHEKMSSLLAEYIRRNELI